MKATAHSEHGFCWFLKLPLSIDEEQYLIQHMKHIPQVFLKAIKLKGSSVQFKEDESLLKLSW